MRDVERLYEVYEEIQAENPYAYFELACTKTTDWMAWITDRPGRGPAGSAEWEASRKVIAKGQGNTPNAAARAALLSMGIKNDAR